MLSFYVFRSVLLMRFFFPVIFCAVHIVLFDVRLLVFGPRNARLLIFYLLLVSMCNQSNGQMLNKFYFIFFFLTVLNM